jgi:hypothetical protein
MGKAFGLILMLIALYVGMAIYSEGIEHAFGGAFAPLQPASERDEPLATHLAPGAQMADAPSEPRRRRRVPLTQAVRDRVKADIESGTRRRKY